MVKDISAKRPITIVNSINPYRIEGQKTASFEICDSLNDSPDFLILPVGNAGNITAYWKGFKEYYSLKKSSKLPKMMGFQAAGAAPIVENRVFENPETIATAIRIGNPASWEFAVNAAKESGGNIDKVTDDEILEAYSILAKRRRICRTSFSCIYCWTIKINKEKGFKKGEKIVCVLTGHGLKTGYSYKEQYISYFSRSRYYAIEKRDIWIGVDVIGPVKVPATTANFGSGFDCLGAALGFITILKWILQKRMK